MAARVNKKLVLILLCTIFAAGAAVGSLLYLHVRGDAARQVRIGDQLAAEGDFSAASRHYGRAVRLDPGNLETLRKFDSALREIRPETGDAARTQYGRLLAALRQEAQYRPTDPESHLRLLRELYSSARLMGMLAPPAARRGHWEQVAAAAADMLERVPSTDPDYAYGYLYRGMAHVRLRVAMSDAELERAERDLVTFLEERPNHDLGWATLAEGRRLIAEHLQTSGQQRPAAAMREKALATYEQAIEAVPDGPEVNRAYARKLVGRWRDDPNAVYEHDVLAAVQRAAALVPKSNDPWLLLDVSETLQMVGGSQSLELAKQLYADYVAEHAEAHAHRYFLAQLQYRHGEFDDAVDTATAIIDAEPLRVGFLSQMQLTLRRFAASLIVDIEHQRYNVAMEETGEADADPIRRARQQLASFVLDPENDPHLLRADARIALVEGRFEDAAAGLERLIRDGSGDTETLLSSAFALERIGQIGLAHERTAQALSSARRPVPVLLMRKARLEYQMGRFDDASESISQVLDVNPADSQALSLARSIEAARAGNPIESDDPVVMALLDSQQAMENGDLEMARSVISAAMAEVQGDDPRLLDAAARIAMSEGQTEQAHAYLDRALALQPENRRFRQLRAVLEAGEPVAAAKRFFEAEYEDEAERTVLLLVTLAAMADQHRETAERREEAGDPIAAEESREVAERAKAELPGLLERASRLAPNDPRLLEYRFTKALEAGEWSEAETIANRARELNSDRARGMVFRGRLDLQRGRFDQAVRAFQQATEMIPYSSLAWRGLALSYHQLGNFREAQRAYDQAYRANPNDFNTIRTYIGLLMQMGEHSRALRIVQNAQRLRPHDVELREVWLELEAEAGDVGVVLAKRREIHKEDPADRVNASRLALLLSRTEPTAEHILDDRGERRYSDRRWRQLSVSEQRRIVRETRDGWRREADRIVRDMAERDGMDLHLASLRALLMRERGDVRGGERALREFIDGHDADDANVQMLLTLAQYQVETGSFGPALATFERALQRQNPDRREADLALGNMFFSRNAFDRAISHFERVLEVAPDRGLELRMAEAYLNKGDFDEAERRLQRVIDSGSMDYVTAILQAMIAHGQASRLFEQERTVEAERKIEAHRQALETAERLMPTHPAPHVARARALLADFRRTGQRATLNDALSALGRADAVRPNDPQTSMVRVEVLRAMGNNTGAVAELGRMIERSPENIGYRRMLVQLHMEAENYNAAIAAVQQAIERYPTMVLWYELLGDVYAHSGRMSDATAAFRRAYELDESTANLIRFVGTLFALENPAYPEVISMLRGLPDVLNGDPVLSGSYAHALYKTGREEAAMQYIGRSYRLMRERIRSEQSHPGDIGTWFQVLHPVFAGMEPSRVERIATELADGQPDAYELLWIARRWQQAGSEGLSRATELLSRAVDLAPQSEPELRMRLQFELANYHLQAENYDAAARFYDRVIRMAPDHAPSLNNLAFLKAEYLDDAAGALPLAQRAIELMPEQASILDTLGWVHFKLGNHAQAEDLLRRSLAVAETAGTQLHLAHVFAAIGEYDSALTRLRRASELRPDAQKQAEIDQLADDIRTKRAERR